MSIAPRLGRAAPERMLGAAALAAAAAVGAGYAVVALQPTDTGRLWQEPFREGAKLLVHSISITLMALLVSTGIGSLATTRYGEGSRWAPAALFAAIAVLTVFYQYGLSPLTAALLGAPLGVRGAVAFFVLVPLGLALGAFMPLGLAAVAASTPHREVYVAWGWAVNGFFSVIGSVLTTALSMSYGFRVVLFLGLAAYAVAALLSGGMRRLTAPTPPI